jgi:hypothetical protein
MKILEFKRLNNDVFRIRLKGLFREKEPMVFFKEDSYRKWYYLNTGEFITGVCENWLTTLNWAVDNNIDSRIF